MDKALICYLINSLKPFSKRDFDTFKDDFYRLIANEIRFKGCPARISHTSAGDFCRFRCIDIKRKNPYKTFFKMPAIFPWNLEYYSAIGINNFKVIQRKYSFLFQRF